MNGNGVREVREVQDGRRVARRRVAGWLLLALLTGSPAAAAGTVQVRQVRHWTAPDHTRVVIDCSAAPTFDEERRGEPERVVINIHRAGFAMDLDPILVDDGLIRRVRLNRLRRSGTAQVVLDLERRDGYRVFALPPAAGRPHRIVVDVLRAELPATTERQRRRIADLKQQQSTIIMIDPGHGGDDPGAIGPGGLQEKSICLAIGRRLRDAINARPGCQAFLTRDRDYYVSLRRRTELARQHDADYFVSVHTNANRNHQVRGSEIYFLSIDGTEDESARLVAQRENAADRIRRVPDASKQVVEQIIIGLLQEADVKRSSDLAGTVVDRLRDDRQLTVRGVKQAGFDVLKTAGMPSILIEVAFITHRREAKLLQSSKFQRRFADLVADGLVAFAGKELATSQAAGD